MRSPRLLALLATLALAGAASTPTWASEPHVGFMRLSAPDPGGAPIEVGVWYPTDTAETAPAGGMESLPVAIGAPVVGQHLPLVVMSHGNGGWFGGHYDTAAALVRKGFVVAALTHTGDNYRDQSRALEMTERPRQLSVLIGYMLDASPMHARIDPAKVGAFGFSSGGFTVLAAAGGEPNLAATFPAHCLKHPGNYDCRLSAGKPLPASTLAPTWTHDARIKAVVSAAPALGFSFGREGLKGVTQPLQLWKAGDDEILPDPDYAEAVHRALPRAHDYRVVPGARHFDFLAPCGPQAARQLPSPLCASAPGFDRAAFHADFNRQVATFFATHLGVGEH